MRHLSLDPCGGESRTELRRSSYCGITLAGSLPKISSNGRNPLKVIGALATALILTIGCSGYAQTEQRRTKSNRIGKSSWQVFSPAGMGFRIEVPSKPHRIDDLYGDADPNGYSSIDVYGVSQSSPLRREYQIIVLVPSEGMLKEDSRGNKLGGLQFTIGGDDAEPTSQSSIRVNGLKGREFIYDFPNAEALGHRKGQIIDAGKKIFILIYATDASSDLNSSATGRFFMSFKTK